MVDIRSILVRHPKSAIGSEYEPFAIDSDAFPTGTGAAEPVTCKCRHGQDRKAGICDRTKDISIEAGCWGAIGTSEEDGVLVNDLEIGARWIGERSIGLGCQSDGELVDTVLVVESSLGVPDSSVSSLVSMKGSTPTYQPLSGTAHNTPV